MDKGRSLCRWTQGWACHFYVDSEAFWVGHDVGGAVLPTLISHQEKKNVEFCFCFESG